MEIIRRHEIPTLSASGVESQQLLFTENSLSERVTITRVTMPPGGVNPRHTHPTSEQIWVALESSASLLLADGKVEPFHEGDVARFADGDLHGQRNTGDKPFSYLSVTSPPINFRKAYGQDWSAAIARENI
jgi:quercetin dioxygenase-like cupin family protein